MKYHSLNANNNSYHIVQIDTIHRNFFLFTSLWFFNANLSNTYFLSSLNIKLYLLGDLDLNSNAVEEYEMISCGIRFGML